MKKLISPLRIPRFVALDDEKAGTAPIPYKLKKSMGNKFQSEKRRQ